MIQIVTTQGILDARSPEATLPGPEELGGKGARCCELARLGFVVPESLVLPVDLYRRHLDNARVSSQIAEMEKASLQERARLSGAIRESILSTAVSKDIMQMVAAWLAGLDHGVAVRSSGTAEDGTARSYAGQFATTLNVLGIQDVERAILDCWASVWRGGAGATMGMAVVIMEMVPAAAAGVLFTVDPVTGARGCFVEAVHGLAERLVSGRQTPERHSLPACGAIHTSVPGSQMSKVVLCETGGVEPVALSGEATRPVLTNGQVQELCQVATLVEEVFGLPQDIEWAIDAAGKIWLLQARDVTAAHVPLAPFAPPIPGAWNIIDHIYRPGTRLFAEYYYDAMMNGWNAEAAEIGIITRMDIREINGFMYYRMLVVSQDEQERLSARLEAYWAERRYLNRLALWDMDVKPGCKARLFALQAVEADNLSHQELLSHFDVCLQATKEMTHAHHNFTYTSFMPMGDFVNKASEWTGAPPSEVLSIIGVGDAPNRLLGAERDPQVAAMLDELRRQPAVRTHMADVRDPVSAMRLIGELGLSAPTIHAGVKHLEKWAGYRILNGYDLSAETYKERPDLLLRGIAGAATASAPMARESRAAAFAQGYPKNTDTSSTSYCRSPSKLPA